MRGEWRRRNIKLRHTITFTILKFVKSVDGTFHAVVGYRSYKEKEKLLQIEGGHKEYSGQ